MNKTLQAGRKLLRFSLPQSFSYEWGRKINSSLDDGNGMCKSLCMRRFNLHSSAMKEHK